MIRERFVSVLFVIWLLTFAPLPTSAAAPVVFTADLFKKQVQETLADEGEETLIRTLTTLHGKFRTLNYPNCFECSLWLIRHTQDVAPAKRLVLAEYAARFSPDLPEAHLHRFATVLAERPGDIAFLGASLWRWISVSLAGPQRDACIAAVLRFVLFFSAALFGAIVAAMLFKYGGAIAHLYSHVSVFSLSHKVLGVAVGSALLLLVLKGAVGVEVIFFLWFFFCYRIARYREIVALVLLCLFYLAADIGTTMLAVTAPDLRGGKWEIYRAVYDPPFTEKVAMDTRDPASLFAAGMQAFYERDWERSDRTLALYGKGLRDRAQLALIANMRGIIANEQGKRQAARTFFLEAVKHDEKPAYLFNLSRALYAEGNIKEAEEVEMRSIALGGKGRYDFPVVVLPRPYDFARESSGVTPPQGFFHDPLARRVTALIMILIITAIMWWIGGAREKVSCCVECGSIICEECSGNDEEVCLTCRALKAGKKILSVSDVKKHTERRERWATRRRLLSIVLSLLLPGMGLIYNDDVVEGLFFLASSLILVFLFFLPRFFAFTAVAPASFAFVPFFIGALFLLLWLISLMRSWHASNVA